MNAVDNILNQLPSYGRCSTLFADRFYSFIRYIPKAIFVKWSQLIPNTTSCTRVVSYSAAEYCILYIYFFISTMSMQKLELEYLVKKRWSRSKTDGLTFCLYLYIYKNFLTSHINLSIVHKNLQFLKSLSFILFFCSSTFFIFFCIFIIIIVYYFLLFLLSHQKIWMFLFWCAKLLHYMIFSFRLFAIRFFTDYLFYNRDFFRTLTDIFIQ